MPKLADIRKDYITRTLSESEMSEFPHDQFVSWLKEAIDQMGDEANVMNLATCNSEGQPSSRIVLLKDLIDQKLLFYTNYESKKSKEMLSNAKVAVCFWWRELERQVRIEGTVSKTSAAISDRYFQSRPKGSQIGAIASPQSEVISDRQDLENRVNAIMDESSSELSRPDHWGGWQIEPHYYEFWQGRASRLHDRFVYQKGINGYKMRRLAP